MMMDRRHFLMASVAAGACIGFDARAESRPVINLQLGWIPSGNQIGEVCAKHLGYYEAEGLELRFQGGGPNIDGVAVVQISRRRTQHQTTARSTPGSPAPHSLRATRPRARRPRARSSSWRPEN